MRPEADRGLHPDVDTWLGELSDETRLLEKLEGLARRSRETCVWSESAVYRLTRLIMLM